MSNIDISVPKASVTEGSKPYTIYTISLRQPLRSHTVQKRYSDFTALHSSLIAQCDQVPPPVQLPPRNIFRNTVNNPILTEERRVGLEQYLQAINASTDARWRQSRAWTTFLNLPVDKPGTKQNNSNHAAAADHAQPGADAVRSSALQAPITDPSVWLDVHRDLRTHIRDARLAVGRRDQASTAKEQHEASADAKRCLVRATTMISALDKGLQVVGGGSRSTGGNKESKERRDSDATPTLADGEIRRRRDLLNVARKERDNLESVLSSYVTKESAIASTESAAATDAERNSLLRPAGQRQGSQIASSSRRVIGAPLPETNQTRELDNAGVLKLQQKVMEEQDQDVVDLTKVVRRMKEMGLAINEETVLQNKMLGIMEEDAERHQRKTDIAKKKIKEIK